MSNYLRQSTNSQEVVLGPFVDDSDGKTPENALTIPNTDIKIWKEGATTMVNKNSGGATYITSSNGLYVAVLDSTDTNTLGKLEIHILETGALPLRREYMVISQESYDEIVTGGSTPSSAITTVYLFYKDIDSLFDYKGGYGSNATWVIEKVNRDTLSTTIATAAGNTRFIRLEDAWAHKFELTYA